MFPVSSPVLYCAAAPAAGCGDLPEPGLSQDSVVNGRLLSPPCAEHTQLCAVALEGKNSGLGFLGFLATSMMNLKIVTLSNSLQIVTQFLYE